MLIQAGAFEGVDAALMAHPIAVDIADPPMFGVERVTVTYRETVVPHPVARETAVNALDGLVTAYQAIAQMRQHSYPSRLAGSGRDSLRWRREQRNTRSRSRQV